MPDRLAVDSGAIRQRRPVWRARAARAIELGQIEVDSNAFALADAACPMLSAHVAAGVAIYLHDSLRGAGGLGVILLAGGEAGCHHDEERAAERIAALIGALSPTPAERRHLAAHVFGGAAPPQDDSDRYLGARCAAFVLRVLDLEGVPILGANLGGCFPRRIRFEPRTARLETEYLCLSRAQALSAHERGSVSRREVDHAIG